jgi:TatD DNase family protein
MILVDSHCHIHDPKYCPDPKATLEKAAENDIKKIVVVGTSPRDNETARAFAEKYKNVYYAAGFHPEELKGFGDSYEDIESLSLKMDSDSSVRPGKLVAIGEIGLEYHYPVAPREKQIRLLENMLCLAEKTELPVIFHVREAVPDFLGLVKNFPKIKKAVVHSFSDDQKSLEKILSETNFYIGVNGLATFADIPLPPLDRMLLETDAPFLTPVPFRGKINEPAYISAIADFVAHKLGATKETIAAATTKNVKELFGI